MYGHDLGRWTRAGLLPVVVLGTCALSTAPDALKRPLRASPSPSATDGPTLDSRTGGWRTRLAAATLFVAPLSFFVYVTQEPALAVFKHLMETAGAGLPGLVAYLAPPLLVITGSVLVGLALRRLLPRTLAVAAGGRVPGAPRGGVPAGPETADPEAAVESSS